MQKRYNYDDSKLDTFLESVENVKVDEKDTIQEENYCAC